MTTHEETKSASSQNKKIEHNIRRQTSLAIDEAAKIFNIRVDSRSFIEVSTSQYTIINVPVTLDDLNCIDDIVDGRPIMFMYLELGPEEDIPRGFYTLGAGDYANVAVLRDRNGQAVARGSLKLTYGDLPPGVVAAPVSLDLSKNKICGDISAKAYGVPFEAKGCIKVKVEVEGEVCIPSCD
jgi:hypothetical protein